MESLARPQATLVDLLDRVLDRGLVLNADIIISLAGVPLIGINLRAALAGMETMVRHGVMTEWDQSIRARETEASKVSQAAAGCNEQLPLATAVSHQ
ncbi:MAG: gas vesicle protein [Chloroflexi bacterium]|nr:gas vesicle protein [Chloroflexota bacterium]